MASGEESCGDFSVGLWHCITVDHASHVSSIAWDLLAADLMGRASNPVLCKLACVAKDILVYLGASGQAGLTHHGLFESDAAHVCFIAS